MFSEIFCLHSYFSVCHAVALQCLNHVIYVLLGHKYTVVDLEGPPLGDGPMPSVYS